MKEYMTQKDAIAAVTIMLGTWFVMSFWLSPATAIIWVNELFIGSVLVGLGLLELREPRGWHSLAGSLVGVWLVIAAASFKPTSGATWDAMAVGTAVILLSVWDGLVVKKLAEYRHSAGDR